MQGHQYYKGNIGTVRRGTTLSLSYTHAQLARRSYRVRQKHLSVLRTQSLSQILFDPIWEMSKENEMNQWNKNFCQYQYGKVFSKFRVLIYLRNNTENSHFEKSNLQQQKMIHTLPTHWKSELIQMNYICYLIKAMRNDETDFQEETNSRTKITPKIK